MGSLLKRLPMVRFAKLRGKREASSSLLSRDGDRGFVFSMRQGDSFSAGDFGKDSLVALVEIAGTYDVAHTTISRLMARF